MMIGLDIGEESIFLYAFPFPRQNPGSIHKPKDSPDRILVLLAAASQNFRRMLAWHVKCFGLPGIWCVFFIFSYQATF